MEMCLAFGIGVIVTLAIGESRWTKFEKQFDNALGLKKNPKSDYEKSWDRMMRQFDKELKQIRIA